MIIIEIIDDGIGFNYDNIDFNENEHIGLMNIKYRLEHMCEGEMIIDSKLNEGTVITITLEK